MSKVVALTALLIAAAASWSSPPPASLVVTGARIWTGDEDRPWAEALAVRGDTIVAVGTDAEIAPLIGDRTDVVLESGAMLVPGFIDSHVHFLYGGRELSSVQLRDAHSPAEFARRIGAFARTLEPGEWVVGGTWDHTNWGGALPERGWIDAVTPDNPVWLERLDGHMGLANSRALAAAGIDADSAEVAGGEIVRGADGAPTGVLKDNAMALVTAAIPAPTDAQRDRWLNAAMRHFASHGVTTVHDMGDFVDLATFRRAHRAGRLSLRVYSLVPLPKWRQLRDDVRTNGRGDSWLRTGGLKGFMDGSLGSHTAALFEPFSDAPDDRGLMIHDPADMREWIAGADRAGLHVAVHAIGDRAIRELLDIYAQVAADNGERDRRLRMEHAQHIHAADLGRFAGQRVIASMQPYHAIDDGRWAEAVIGPERARTTYAFASLIKSGARVAFGSDWTVAPASPIEGIYAAVTRRTLAGAHPDGWVPEQKITVEQALRAYTVEGAYASFEENLKGRLKPGMLADFVLIDRDLTAIAPATIRDAQVLKTAVGGRLVYSAAPAEVEQ